MTGLRSAFSIKIVRLILIFNSNHRLEKLYSKYCNFEEPSTPEKTELPNDNENNCESALENFMCEFSPEAGQYLKNLGAKFPHSSFLKTLTPSRFIESLSLSRSETNEPTTPVGYYPNSMLVGNADAFVSSPSVLEKYIEGSKSEESQQNPIDQLLTQPKYVEEVLGTLQGNNYWQNALLANNLLPPLTMSSYEDIVNFQQELMQHNKTSEQVVYPVYFHTMAVSENESPSEQQEMTNKSKRQLFDDKAITSIGLKNESPIQNLTYDEDLLRRCQEACFESENYIADMACNSEGEESNSMKYLEEAAVRLLLNSKRRTYRRRNPNDTECRFVCKYCGKKFARMFTLQTHERVHSGVKPYQCEICGRSFRQSGTKLNHMRAVHDKEKPYKCEFCPKTFGHKSSLVVHRRIHTKEKPFECEICGRKFTDRATMKKHVPTHTKEKNHRCTYCGKCLTQQSNLKRHIKTIHLKGK